MDFYTKTVEQTFEEQQTTLKGLHRSDIQKRQQKFGKNIIEVKGEPLWKKLITPFIDIFMVVLFAAVAVSIWQGEHIDAIIIGAIMIINAAIYYIQRFSTERILRSLQKKTVNVVDVIRDGKNIEVDESELVPGDLVIIDEGEKIPADCRLIETSSLRVDESMLTGESLPVEKQTDALAKGQEIYEQSNMIFQGSFVVGGQARAIVVATGRQTQFGRIASLSVTADEISPVQKRINRLIEMLVRVIAAISVVTFALSLYRGMDVAEALRYVLSLAVSAVPESLPVAITVVLVLGMRRMAKKKALVKSPAAIENIGILTTIATDKTGTLTRNKLSVQHLWSSTSHADSVEKALALSWLGATSQTRDPLDESLEAYAKYEKISRTGELIETLPFEQTAVMSGNIVREKGVNTLWVKGSPERMIEVSKLTDSERKTIQKEVLELATNGLRVIAFAHATIKQPFESFEDMPTGLNFHFDGLVGVADTLRPEAHGAIRRAHKAGIRVCMVTGDHFETAYHIGRQLGIVESRDEVFDSRKMHKMTDDELAKVARTVRVYARVIPEHKHRLLTVLKRDQITAMTGDGVNDVPALTGAHIGIAMGSGTSIAKDAGDIILLDNNFRSIVTAVHEGRTVYANIKRMVSYLTATNAGEVLVALSALILGVPVPLVSVQILWVNLVTDSCMAIPLGLEPGERRNMLKPPQRHDAPLFSRMMIWRIAITAIVMGVVTVGMYLFYLDSKNVEYARTIAFNALVVMQWASAFNSRSDYESVFKRIKRFSGAFYIGLAAAVGIHLFAMAGPLHDFLYIYSVDLDQLLLTSLIAFIAPILVVEIHKWIGRRFYGKGSLGRK